MIKSLTLLLTILFSTGLSAQEINKKYHHHEFGGSLSVGSNPADNTVRDIRSQYCRIKESALIYWEKALR